MFDQNALVSIIRQQPLGLQNILGLIEIQYHSFQHLHFNFTEVAIGSNKTRDQTTANACLPCCFIQLESLCMSGVPIVSARSWRALWTNLDQSRSISSTYTVQCTKRFLTPVFVVMLTKFWEFQHRISYSSAYVIGEGDISSTFSSPWTSDSLHFQRLWCLLISAYYSWCYCLDPSEVWGGEVPGLQETLYPWYKTNSKKY